jgi:hypothetical protein
MIDPASLYHAIAAHAKWKFRLREAIHAGQSEWTVDAVRPDDRCEFGRWLISLPLSDRMSKEWREAKELHARFHASAAEVLGSALAGRKVEADAAMAPGGAFADVSTKLVRLLTDWKKRVSGSRGG